MAMQLNEKNFSEEVLKSDVPVLVDFWAEWCMPCKMLAPVIEELSSEANGTYKVAKVNVDEAPSLAAQYEVMSIPTVLVFRNGQITNKSIGVVPKASLLELLK
ncbi:MAG: thioredoxin [Blautia sp.]|nr:thioredoxin [Blautia sp.]MDD7371613.1 thioredoxin [Bacillota bacterium]